MRSGTGIETSPLFWGRGMNDTRYNILVKQSAEVCLPPWPARRKLPAAGAAAPQLTRTLGGHEMHAGGWQNSDLGEGTVLA